MTNSKCIIDGNQGKSLIEQFGWLYTRCPQCGLQWVANSPTVQQLADLYSPASGYQRHHARQPVDRANPHYKMLVRLALAAKDSPARVLDIGCSAGDVAVPLMEFGYAVDGIEPNETTAPVAAGRGVTIIGRDIQSLSDDAQYDLIIASEVIEHVPDPGVFLARVRRALKPDGVLILSTPNTASWFARASAYLLPRIGVPVSYLTAPYHLTYFNPQTLQALLARHDLKANSFHFRYGPSLRYELGNLHLWGPFKRGRSVGSFFRMLFGFSVTTALWCVDRLFVTCGSPGFQMYTVASSGAVDSPAPVVHSARVSSSIFRFLVGGIAITALQAALVYLFASVLGIWYLISAQLAFIVAFIASFVLYREWVFPTANARVGRQFFSYAFLTGLNFIANGVLMYLLVTWVGFGPVSSQVMVKALISGLNFFAYRSIVFRI